MGRSVSAWSCPCGYLGTKREFRKHIKRCKVFKRAMIKEAIFKRKIKVK